MKNINEGILTTALILGFFALLPFVGVWLLIPAVILTIIVFIDDKYYEQKTTKKVFAIILIFLLMIYHSFILYKFYEDIRGPDWNNDDFPYVDTNYIDTNDLDKPIDSLLVTPDAVDTVSTHPDDTDVGGPGLPPN